MLVSINKMIREYRRIRPTLKKLSERKNISLAPLEYQRFKEIKEKGFTVIENYLADEKCERYCEEIDRLLETYPQYVWQDEFNSDMRIYGAEKLSSQIMEYYAAEDLNRYANAFNGIKTINSHTLIGRLKFAENNLGSGQGWHRDTASPYQFKSLLYLTDVGNENGPFQYVEGTQHYSSLFLGIWKYGHEVNQTRFKQEEVDALLKSEKFKLHTLQGKRGTLVLVNTFGLHRGKPIEQGTRYALTNYFMTERGYNRDFTAKKFNLPN